MPTWKEHVKDTYAQMKAAGSKTTLKLAMAEAKKTYTPIKVQMAPKQEKQQDTELPAKEPVGPSVGDTRVLDTLRNPFILRFNN